MLRNSPKVTHLASGRARFWVGLREGKVQITKCLMGHAKEFGVYLGNNGKPWKDATQLVTQVVVQLPSHVWLFATPWTVAHQASLTFTISRSLPKFIGIALMMPFSRLILWHPLLLCLQSFSVSGTFPMSSLLASDDQNTGASASVSLLPVNIQSLSL